MCMWSSKLTGRGQVITAMYVKVWGIEWVNSSEKTNDAFKFFGPSLMHVEYDAKKKFANDCFSR